ncbi:MAG TPA: hypothetical protein EYN67_20940 [Flavobacteriales bacterium]|nr:hypothetical protein [Flavobacteriales bacterium]HHZ97948.1 hypothetical protein [Flavobacteriales bacterium]
MAKQLIKKNRKGKSLGRKRRARNQRSRPMPAVAAQPGSDKVRRRRRSPQQAAVRRFEIRQQNTVRSAYAKQRSQGAAPSINQSPGEPLNDTARALLEGLGCTILSQQVYTQNHSLISEQTDTEMIENTNIMDQNIFDKLSPTAVNAGQNFKNFNNPIFTLDQPLPRAQTKMRDKVKEKLETPNIEMITADLIDLNRNSHGRRVLKQFK